mmetsp:Transcript_17617/g.46893  ORF Transcript_17617/g.46893 Transcript_17617/m.46893 type:complete len:105 (+) Transcript_17617:252-566(+)
MRVGRCLARGVRVGDECELVGYARVGCCLRRCCVACGCHVVQCCICRGLTLFEHLVMLHGAMKRRFMMTGEINVERGNLKRVKMERGKMERVKTERVKMERVGV